MGRKLLWISGFINESVEEFRWLTCAPDVAKVRQVAGLQNERNGAVSQSSSLAVVARIAGRCLAVASPVIAHVLIIHSSLEAPWARSRVPTMPVVVASRDIPEGAVIDFYALKVAHWPAGTVPPGAYASVDDVDHRVARVAIYKGEAIVPSRLAPQVGGLEVKLTPGKRAYSIRVRDVAGLGHFIRPNSRVDVVVVLDDPGQGGRRAAKLFLQNLRVLAINTTVARTTDGSVPLGFVATLEVTGQEAELLAIAASQGSLQLVLRGSADPSYVDTQGVTAREVLDQLRRPANRWIPAGHPRPSNAVP